MPFDIPLLFAARHAAHEVTVRVPDESRSQIEKPRMPEAAATIPAWISLVGVGLAALAAAASWASVRLNRRQWLLSQQPFLSIQLLIERNGDRVLKILNGGPGSARGVRFCVATADEYVAGYAGEQFGGVLNTGERAEVVLDIQAGRDDQIKAVAICWDGVERVHVFTAHADHRTHRKSQRNPVDATNPEAAFRDRYGVDSLRGLRRAHGRGRSNG